MAWKDEYSVGLDTIDEQHKKFIAMLSRLSDALAVNRDNITSILDELVEYADEHLSFEEKYFAEFHYDCTDDHIKEHDFYRKKIAEFQEAFFDGRDLLLVEMLEFLERWLEHHIMISDRKYVECFREYGMK